VVRQWFAKPLFPSSNLGAASKNNHIHIQNINVIIVIILNIKKTIPIILILVVTFLNFKFKGSEAVYIILLIATSLFYLSNFLKSTAETALINKTNQKNIPDSTTKAIQELETAKIVQEALLSIESPHIKNINIAKKCIPASSLGGDFYTFVNKTIDNLKQNSTTPGVLKYHKNQNNILGVAIGDVAGHGVSSALVMALASGLLDRIGQNNLSPATILQRANRDIEKFISNSKISHVTAYYCSINISDMTFTYSNAGHQPALIIHADDSYELLTTEGIFLGMYPDEIYNENTKILSPGDRIFLFTDGIIESINDKDEIYGITRLKDIAIKHKNKTIAKILDEIHIDLNQFRKQKEPKDDQTAIIIEIEKNNH